MQRLTISLALALIVLTLPMTADATVVIDDFEKGSFYYQQFPPTIGEWSVPVNEPAHCLGPNRTVELRPGFGQSEITALLNAGQETDDKVVVNCINGGEMMLGYDWPMPLDLTAAGTVDRLEINLPQTVFSATITLTLGNGTSVETRTESAGSPGLVTFYLADFMPVATGAISARITFDANSQDGQMVVSDIRTKRDGGYFAQFLGDFVATAWPPLPASPLSYRTRTVSGQNLYRTKVAVLNVDNGGFVPQMSADWSQVPFHDGEMAAMKFWWDDEAAYDNAMFELSFEFSKAGGLEPEIVYPPDPSIGTQSLGIMTGVRVRDDGTGVPVGTSCINIVFTTGLYQELIFQNVIVVPFLSKAGTAEGFTVSFMLEGYNIEQNEPLFEVAVVSDWSTTATTAVESVVPGEPDRLRLVASPSVMRSRTELSVSHALARPGAIGVYDTSGRLVRSLALAVGELSAVWDGRDHGGSSLPSGIYWARVENGAAGTATRVVRLR